VNCKSVTVWKETLLSYIKLYSYSDWGKSRNHSVKIGSDPAEIWIGYVPKTSPEIYR